MNNKKSNGAIIGLLIGIIIMLLVFVALFATNTISFNSKTNNDDKTTNTKEDNTSEENNEYQINYKEEEYRTKRSDGTEISNSTRNLPVIKNNKNQNAADKIVNYLTSVSNSNWDNNVKPMADQVANDNLPYSGLGVKYLFETGVVTNNRLTFNLTMTGGFGGVSWSSEEGFNFNAKTGEILTTENIAINKDVFKKYLLNKTNEKINTIKINKDNCINDNYDKKLEEEINKEGNWYFTKTELIIKLQKYTVACGAGGIIEVNLPKEEVNQYLKEEYKILEQ